MDNTNNKQNILIIDDNHKNIQVNSHYIRQKKFLDKAPREIKMGKTISLSI